MCSVEKVKTVHESFITVEEDVKSLVGDMTTVSDEVSAVLSANEVIVDGISTLSGITQEISAKHFRKQNGYGWSA